MHQGNMGERKKKVEKIEWLKQMLTENRREMVRNKRNLTTNQKKKQPTKVVHYRYTFMYQVL